MTQSTDLIVIGGGLIGLATAWQFLQQQPGRSVLLLEKEAAVAQHQSGRNSGVLHSGIYYAPDSHKAYHCRYGKGLLRAFCQAENLPLRETGKLIVAIDDDERAPLRALYQRGLANGVRCTWLEQDALRQIEPYAAGVAAVHVGEAAVVDFQRVAQRLAERIAAAGGRVLTDSAVVGVQERPEGVIVQTAGATLIGRVAVNAAGLYADRIARLAGVQPHVKIVPFRGEYYRLRPAATHLVRGLIYPVPDPTLPFLGVHFTRTLYGEVDCGPNAVLAGSREGYRKGQINLRDSLEQLTSRRVRRLTQRHLQTALWEQRRAWSKALFALTLQRLVPAVSADDLLPAPAGVRAQALTPAGELVNDFVFTQTARMVHVLSAPSPGATACLSVGRTIAQRLAARL